MRTFRQGYGSERQAVTKFYLRWAHSRLSDILIHLDVIGKLFARVEDLGIDSVDQRQLRGLSISTEDLRWSAIWVSYDLSDVQDQAFVDVWLD